MKAKTIWIIVGVIALILIIANWNKIFGKNEKKKYGGQPINDYRVGGVAPGVPPSGTTARPGVGPSQSGGTQKQKGDAKAKCMAACYSRPNATNELCESLCGWISSEA